MSQPLPLGIWESTYSYPSTGREGMFEGHHFVRLHRKDNHLVFESMPNVNESYVIIRLSVDDNVATGSWQEHTDAEGYYKGAVYYGAIQLIVSDDHKKLTGKWVGFGKDMDVNVGPWELTYIGEKLPNDT
jgi:hypothetical protein